MSHQFGAPSSPYKTTAAAVVKVGCRFRVLRSFAFVLQSEEKAAPALPVTFDTLTAGSLTQAPFMPEPMLQNKCPFHHGGVRDPPYKLWCCGAEFCPECDDLQKRFRFCPLCGVDRVATAKGAAVFVFDAFTTVCAAFYADVDDGKEPPADAITLHFRNLFAPTSVLTLRVSPTITEDRLLEKVHKALFNPKGYNRVVFNGRLIEGKQTLAQSGIADGTIMVYSRILYGS